MMKLFRTAQSIAISVSMVLSPVANALKLEVKAGVAVRDLNDQGLERVGFLQPGSVLDIPDEYAVRDTSGKVNTELTLNKWLQKAGEVNGAASEFYFPVRIDKNKAAAGSDTAKLTNGVYFVGLKYLARHNGLIVTADPTPVHPGPKPSSLPKPIETERTDKTPDKPVPQAQGSAEANQSKLEATSPCAGGHCLQNNSPPFAGMVKDLSKALKREDERLKTFERYDIEKANNLADTFKDDCGMSLHEFMPTLRDHAQDAGVPAEILMGIMTRESGGKCFRQDDGRGSRGIFQVNARRSHKPRCTAEQISTLRHTKASQLSKAPQCLENPLVNLDEAIKVLKEKMAALTPSKTDPKTGAVTYTQFDPTKMSKNELWRLTLSAYNGGEHWVFRAKQDLEIFNKRNGTNLNVNNWEDLRVFFLRRFLDRTKGAQTQYFGNTPRGRKEKYQIDNLAYSEELMPRDDAASARGTLGEYWRQHIDEI